MWKLCNNFFLLVSQKNSTSHGDEAGDGNVDVHMARRNSQRQQRNLSPICKGRWYANIHSLSTYAPLMSRDGCGFLRLWWLCKVKGIYSFFCCMGQAAVNVCCARTMKGKLKELGCTKGKWAGNKDKVSTIYKLVGDQCNAKRRKDTLSGQRRRRSDNGCKEQIGQVNNKEVWGQGVRNEPRLCCGMLG